MHLNLDPTKADPYTGSTQRVKAMTEHWMATHLPCPACGHHRLNAFPNNARVADAYCAECNEQYELKSTSRRFSARVQDGAYNAMIGRLGLDSSPNFLFLTYGRQSQSVTDLQLVPKHFFTPNIIEKRAPLGPSARRAGWVGCVILLSEIPRAGRITLVANGVPTQPVEIHVAWCKTLFLRQQAASARGWLLEVMRCVDRVGPTFTLDQIYAFEADMLQRHPDNANIRPKIRQQLQKLRDTGYLEFVGGGRYRRL